MFFFSAILSKKEIFPVCFSGRQGPPTRESALKKDFLLDEQSFYFKNIGGTNKYNIVTSSESVFHSL